MNVLLTNSVLALDADELIAYVRISFHIDKEGYVYGNKKELATITDMSVPRLKKALDGLFEKKMISYGEGKIFVWNYETNISFTDGEMPIVQNSPEKTVRIETQKDSSNDIVKMVCEYFNKAIIGKGMPQIKAITPKRKASVNARLKEYGYEQVIKMIDNAAASAFLNGQVSNFMASFDWIMRPNNFTKVLEGNYNGRKGNNKSAEQNYYQDASNLMQRIYSEREGANNK